RLRRAALPRDARALRRPARPDRDPDRARRPCLRDPLAAPARTDARVDGRRGRDGDVRRRADRGAPVRLPADQIHNRWHPGIDPVATVQPGDEITFETRDGLDRQLTRESTHADAGRLDLGLGHPLTGPVSVEGAEPGTVLEVEFVAYES